MKLAERILVIVDPADELTAALRAAQRLVPHARRIHVVALLADARAPHRDTLAKGLEAMEAALERWPRATGEAAISTSFEVIFEAGKLAETAARTRADLVLIGPWRSRPARERVLAMLELSSRGARRVLSLGAGVTAGAPRTGVLGLAFEGVAGLASLAAAMPQVTGFSRVVALSLGGDDAQAEEIDAALHALLPSFAVELVRLPSFPVSAAEHVARAAAERGVELVIAPREGSDLAAAVTGLLAGQVLQDAATPFLLVRTGESPAERLFASDTMWLPGVPARVALERVGTLGRVALPEDARVILPGTPALGALPLEAAGVAIPPTWLIGEERLHPLALALDGAPEQLAVCHAIGVARPAVLVDSRLPQESFDDLERLAADFELIFVRLRTDEPLHELRARLLARLPWGGPALVIDAQAWLDDGGASDVPVAADAQRLVRLALRLRALGARASAVVTSANAHVELLRELPVFTPASLARRTPGAPAPAPRATVTDPLTLLSRAEPVAGNQVELELDNGVARRALLEAARAARRRLHLQSYIFEDDAVVRELCDALVAAAARGVEVRVLADALYSLHDVYGTTNVVLERLARAPGVEVRAWQPLTGVPSIADLKQRNHRKLVIADGERAWVSGRNLGSVYYQGFDEVKLSTSSVYPDVPWLDCSVRIDGPLVAAAERAFLADWVRAGGSEYAVVTPPPAGAMTCRLVLHDGLVDTHTLDAQRELIDRAAEDLVVVSTFPLVIELQHALVAAVRRGVRVRVLFGNVRPRWGEGTPFAGALYRELGDELVRSRLEPVLRAGAEGYELALLPREGWSPELGRVFPHVHAKVMVRDGQEAAIGSANVDVTSAYWENEAMLVVHDEGFARGTLEALAPYFATSRRVDLRSGDWEPQHARREWLGKHWPNLVG